MPSRKKLSRKPRKPSAHGFDMRSIWLINWLNDWLNDWLID
jgi:hypothetical protein